jgi:hypothetical protein
MSRLAGDMSEKSRARSQAHFAALAAREAAYKAAREATYTYLFSIPICP